MTPLPETLSTDLNEVKALIDERLAQRAVHQKNISNEGMQLKEVNAEIKILQKHVGVLIGTESKPVEGKTVDGKKVEKEPKEGKPDTEKTP